MSVDEPACDAESGLLAQARLLPQLIEAGIWPLEARVRRLIDTPTIYGIRQIVLVGSGDSHCAALAAAPAFRAWTGIAVHPMSTMDASRYLDMGRSDHAAGTLAVLISVSGAGARIVEASRRLAAIGATITAVTAAPSSALAAGAHYVLETPAAPSGAAPGSGSYIASLLALMLLAIRLGEVRQRHTMDEAGAYRLELARLAATLAASLPASRMPCAAFVEDAAPHHAVDCLGSGPAFGSAAYLAAKLVEAAGLHVMAQDTEEFCHLNFFNARPAETPTILFSSRSSASASRGDEVAGILRTLGRPTLLITDDPDAPAGALILPAVPELLLPLLHAVPAALLAAQWGDQLGAVPFRGHSGRWGAALDAGAVRRSAIVMKGDAA